MKYYLWIGMAACTFFLGTRMFAAPFDELLPQKGTEGHLMTVSTPDRLKELTAKMLNSIRKNQEWFINVSKQANGPLSYDEKLGVSREEYEEYKKLIKQGSLKDCGSFKIDLVVNSDGSRSLDTVPSMPPLKSLKFDSKREVIETPYGMLKDPKEFTVTEKGGPLGPWKGLVYQLIEGTPESILKGGSGKSVEFTIGRQNETGRRFLIYKALVDENGSRTEGFEFIVIYD